MSNYNNTAPLSADVRLLSEDEIHSVSGGEIISDDLGAILLGLAAAYFSGALGELWDWLFG